MRTKLGWRRPRFSRVALLLHAPYHAHPCCLIVPVPPPQVKDVVATVMADLGLTGVADTIIGGGDNEAANISGGQLKRVNVACELVALARPAILLTDEPTAGLDASIAEDLVRALVGLTHSGVTLLLVLQQPRSEIFALLDHLVLMREGGVVVYEGPPAGAVAHFVAQGYSLPPDTAEADFLIDVLNGIVAPQSRAVEGAPAAPAEVGRCDAPRATIDGALTLRAPAAVVDLPPVPTPIVRGDSTGSASGHHAGARLAQRHGGVRAWVAQAALQARRTALFRLRDAPALRVFGLLHALMAVALSSGFSILIQNSYRGTLSPAAPAAFREYCPVWLRAVGFCDDNVNDMGMQQLLFFMSDALGCASALAGVGLLGGMLPVVKREAAGGVSASAFVVGRMVADLLPLTMNALVFAGVWQVFGHAGHWYHWLGVILPTAFAAAGVGYVASVLTRPANAALITIITVTATCVFSGVEPPLAAVADLPVVNWPWYLSFATWTAEATYFTFSQHMVPARAADVARGALHYGYDVDSQARAVGALIGIGLMWRAIALAIVVWRTRPARVARRQPAKAAAT
jgi:energy-coupling factor transporter ATP-binding protein EcfA2